MQTTRLGRFSVHPCFRVDVVQTERQFTSYRKVYIDILSRFPMSITYPDYMRACAGFSQMTRGAPDVFCAIDRVPK